MSSELRCGGIIARMTSMHGSAIPYERILEYREETYRLKPRLKVRSKEGAIDYVNERGFVYFWPIKDVTLPSVWGAVAGDRPVPDAHDDPGHVTWGWKDELLGAHKWHYAKVLRKKATMISLEVLPHFYALSQNYGEPEQDYLDQYKAGQMTYDAKTVYEVLLEKGPLDTQELRRQSRMTAKASDSPFNRAIEFLQADFKVQPVGVAEVGRWKYAFIYECVHRWNPDLAEQARPVRQSQARENLVGLYLKSVGAVQAKQVDMLFGWGKTETQKTVHALVRSGLLTLDVGVPEHGDGWLALTSLVG